MWVSSFTLRAILAIGLLVGFYVVAIGIALCLLAIPILEFLTLGRLHLYVGIGCVVGACLILWSLVPRGQSFEAPGPNIIATEHPKLFALIQEVASSMGMAVPENVYLVPDVNAFVSHVGGLLGFGGRRVMGIGVPLLSCLTVSQLKAVIAHEFGHFAGGDTSLSGLLYATRSAMIRTQENLIKSGQRMLVVPFIEMFKVFMALTHAIYRQQELLADEWAVKLAGLEAHCATLRLVGLHSNAYEIFLRSEVAPLISLGLIPKNVFEGYRQFVGSSLFVAVTPEIESQLKAEKTNRYDSHPAAEERIRFAESLALPLVPMDTTPAYSLISQPARVEEAFSEGIPGHALASISWDEVPNSYQRLWKRSAIHLQARLPTMNVGMIRHYLLRADAQDELAEAVEPTLVGNRSPERGDNVRGTVARMLHAYVSSLLCTHGWSCHGSPGEPIKLHRDGHELDVKDQIIQSMRGVTSSDALMDALRISGIEDSTVLKCSDHERNVALVAHCPVMLQETKKYATVTGPMGAMVFPQCCAICCGPLEHRQRISFKIGGFFKRGGELSMVVPLCQAHSNRGGRAWDVRAVVKKNGTLTLRVPNLSYARLFPCVNA